MIDLYDVGRDMLLTFDGGLYAETYQTEIKVIMTISAPRGMLTLFRTEPTVKNIDNQCKAIRAFMEEHKHD